MIGIKLYVAALVSAQQVDDGDRLTFEGLGKYIACLCLNRPVTLRGTCAKRGLGPGWPPISLTRYRDAEMRRRALGLVDDSGSVGVPSVTDPEYLDQPRVVVDAEDNPVGAPPG